MTTNFDAIDVIDGASGVISEVSSFALRSDSHRKPPLAPIETIVAVDTVLLAAGDIPSALLKRFYVDIVGLTPIPTSDADLFRFKHARRELLLARHHKSLGSVKLTIRNLSEVLQRFRDAHVHYDLLRTYDGLVTTIVLRDPAGNIVNLQQTRSL